MPLPNARLVALDAHTGRVAWEVGDADARAASSRTTCQSAIGSLTPELTPGRAGNVLMVFALPQSASGRPSR